MSGQCQLRLVHRARRVNHTMMTIGQHAVCAGESIPLSTWNHPQADKSIPGTNLIVHKMGKFITQMLLQGIK